MPFLSFTCAEIVLSLAFCNSSYTLVNKVLSLLYLLHHFVFVCCLFWPASRCFIHRSLKHLLAPSSPNHFFQVFSHRFLLIRWKRGPKKEEKCIFSVSACFYFFFFFGGKRCENPGKDNFDEWIACKAPVHWPKSTPLGYFCQQLEKLLVVVTSLLNNF